MKKLLVITSLFLAATAASAGPVNVTFISFHNGSPTDWQDGYQYSAAINNGATIAVMCDDWAHGGLPGDIWQANVTDLGTINAGNILSSSLRFNQLPNAATLYDEAGWLLLLTEKVQSSNWTDINQAVWHILDAQAPLTLGARFWLVAAEYEARQGFPGVDFSQVIIFTPVTQHDPTEGVQELLTLDQGPFHPTVPEPSTLVLVAGGLAGLWARKRIR